MRALPSGARIARASASAAVPAFFPDLLLDSDQTISATIATSAITEKIIIAPGESDCANAGPKSAPAIAAAKITVTQNAFLLISRRSEERRVGKEWVSKCRSRWSAYH